MNLMKFNLQRDILHVNACCLCLAVRPHPHLFYGVSSLISFATFGLRFGVYLFLSPIKQDTLSSTKGSFEEDVLSGNCNELCCESII